jgi:hypothetical protein
MKKSTTWKELPKMGTTRLKRRSKQRQEFLQELVEEGQGVEDEGTKSSEEAPSGKKGSK